MHGENIPENDQAFLAIRPKGQEKAATEVQQLLSPDFQGYVQCSFSFLCVAEKN